MPDPQPPELDRDVVQTIAVRIFGKSMATLDLMSDLKHYVCPEHGQVGRDEVTGREPKTCRRFRDGGDKVRCGEPVARTGDPVYGPDKIKPVADLMAQLACMVEEEMRARGLSKNQKVEQHLHLTMNVVQCPLTTEQLESCREDVRSAILEWNGRLRLAAAAQK